MGRANAPERDGVYGFQRVLTPESPEWADVSAQYTPVSGREPFHDPNDDKHFKRMSAFTKQNLRCELAEVPGRDQDHVVAREAVRWMAHQTRPWLCFTSLIRADTPMAQQEAVVRADGLKLCEYQKTYNHTAGTRIQDLLSDPDEQHPIDDAELLRALRLELAVMRE